MPSSIFRFKQFSIQQDRCAMKVSTDGILLGAWADARGAQSALDIGTGTGILSLMLAQRYQGLFVEAIEIDEQAFAQARDNIVASPWKDRIRVYHVALGECHPSHKFDHIICNPPYFTSGPTAVEGKRVLARHQESMTFRDLMHFAHGFLKKGGRMSLIIPQSEEERVLDMAMHSGLFLCRKTMVRYTELKEVSRVLIELGWQQAEKPGFTSLVIQERGTNRYTPDFVELTRDFYEFMD